MGSRVSYLFEKQQFEEIKIKISKSANFILFMSVGSCFGLIGISSNFVPIFYGQGYDEVIPILMLLSPILLITGLSTCLNDMYFTPFGLKKQSAKYVIIGALVNLVCNITLIPVLNSIGAVLGTLIAESTILLLYIFNCNKYLSFRIILQAIWKKIVSAIIMYISIIYINKLIPNHIISLITCIISGAIIYCIVLIILKDSILLEIKKKILKK